MTVINLKEYDPDDHLAEEVGNYLIFFSQDSNLIDLLCSGLSRIFRINLVLMLRDFIWLSFQC